MLTDLEYQTIRTRIDAYETSRNALYHGESCFTHDMIQAIADHSGHQPPTNEERGLVEQYEWNANPPSRYFGYINCERKELTTWTGERLGRVVFGREFRDNFGGKRVPITVYGTNGRMYHGTYYKSSGDYARIKMARKSQIVPSEA